MGESILKVEGLVKKYDRFSLQDINLEIPKGYIMGFVGRNGAGKSTTIKCIMNLIGFDKGEIEVFGLDNRKNSLQIKNRIGYVSEEQYFYEDMTVDWTGRFVGSFYSQWDMKQFDLLLKKFAIDKSKKVKELSKGMRMKLSLALAMSHKSELFILDEPTSGLDPVIRSELLDMFMGIIQDEGCSILFSSHITSDIEKIADYVAIIDDGRIIMSDDKDLIMDKWKVIKLDNEYNTQEICKRLIGVKKGEFGFSGVTDDLVSFAKEFRNAFPGANFKTEKISMDELLVRVVKDGEC